MDKNNKYGAFLSGAIAYIFTISLSYILFPLIKGKGLIYDFILRNSLGDDSLPNRYLMLGVFALSAVTAFILHKYGKTLLMHGLSALIMTAYAAAVYMNSWLEYENIYFTSAAVLLLAVYVTLFLVRVIPVRNDWPGRAAVPLLAVFTTAYIINFIFLSFLRHDLFFSAKLDLGWEHQAIYNLTKTGIPHSSMMGAENNFGDHTSFIYYLISVFYRFWPVPKFLLVFQVLMMAAAGWAVYLLSLEVLKKKAVAAVFAAVFLLHPSVQSYMLFDFHPTSVAVPLFFLAFYFIEKGSIKAFLVPYFLIYTVREDMAFYALVFAVFLIVAGKIKLKPGLIIAGIGFLLCCGIFVLLKSLREGSGDMAIFRYYYMFPSAPGIAVLPFINPFFEILKMMNQKKLEFILIFGLPLAFLFCAKLQIWILMIPAMLFTIFSRDHATIGYHYSTGLIIFAFYGAVLAYGELSKKAGKSFWAGPHLPAYLLVFSVFWSFLYGSFFSKSYKLSGHHNAGFRGFAEYYYNDDVGCYRNPLKLAAMVDKKALSLVDNIPDKYSVTSDFNILPHVSGRRKAFAVEDKIISDIVIVFNDKDYSGWKLQGLLDSQYTTHASTDLITLYVNKEIKDYNF